MPDLFQRAMGGSPMGSLQSEVNASDFTHALHGWWKATKKDLDVMLKDETSLLSEALMNLTPPYAQGGGKGLTPAAKKRSEKVIETETARVFRPLWQMPSNVVAEADDFGLFMKVRASGKATKDKKMGEVVRKIYRDKDTQRAYKRLKNVFKHKPPTGNPARKYLASMSVSIRNSARSQGRIKMSNTNTVFYVENVGSIKAATAAAQADIGKMKSGWAFGAMAITGKFPTRTPAWVSRHGGTYGQGINRLKDTYKPEVELVNRVGNIWGLGLKFNIVQAAFDQRAKNLYSKTKSVLAAAKKTI